MVGKKRNKGLRKQVEDITGDLSSRLSPHVESARDSIAPYVDDARKKAGPALADARDSIAPYVEEARKKAGPALSDARDKATPYVEEARERFTSDVLPAVNGAISDARDKAKPYVEEARKEGRRRGLATAAALRGEVEAPKKGGKLKKVLLVGGVIGLGAFAFAKLRGKDEANAWQSSYAPPAPPSPAPKPDVANKPPAPAAANKPPAPGGVPTPAAPNAGAADPAGASPDEAAADAAAETGTHEVTTPDNPVEEVGVRDDDQPGT